MTGALTLPVTLSAQSAATGSLEFLGFRPGTPRAEAETRLAKLDGRWTCAASRVDPRFTECRGTLRPDGGSSLDLTASLIDGRVAVLVIRGPIGADGLASWRDDLATRYGSVPSKRQHGQDTWQWVRSSRMIRLTTRVEGAVRMVSVSLVDGPLLDGLGPVSRTRPP